jgi:hypothetical protein
MVAGAQIWKEYPDPFPNWNIKFLSEMAQERLAVH